MHPHHSKNGYGSQTVERWNVTNNGIATWQWAGGGGTLHCHVALGLSRVSWRALRAPPQAGGTHDSTRQRGQLTRRGRGQGRKFPIRCGVCRALTAQGILCKSVDQTGHSSQPDANKDTESEANHFLGRALSRVDSSEHGCVPPRLNSGSLL